LDEVDPSAPEVRRRKLSVNQALALTRWRDLKLIAHEYIAAGIGPGEILEWVKLLADTLRILHGKGTFRLTAQHVLRRLPAEWRAAVDTCALAAVVEVMRAAPRVNGLIHPEDAGVMIDLRNIVRATIQKRDDHVIAYIYPIDETEEERDARRKARKREKDRRRYRRKLVKNLTLKNRLANVADHSAHLVTIGGRKTVATSQEDRVMDAVRNGASTITAIRAITDLPNQSVRSLLSRLKKSGTVTNIARGRWVLARASARSDPSVMSTSGSWISETFEMHRPSTLKSANQDGRCSGTPGHIGKRSNRTGSQAGEFLSD
jgi:predicted transcriptional regulator